MIVVVMVAKSHGNSPPMGIGAFLSDTSRF